MGVETPECRLAIKPASATGFFVEPWLHAKDSERQPTSTLAIKVAFKAAGNSLQEKFCKRARLHRLQKNSIREALCVRA
jgi:hypothetical protein